MVHLLHRLYGVDAPEHLLQILSDTCVNNEEKQPNRIGIVIRIGIGIRSFRIILCFFISTTEQLRRDDVTYGDHGQSGQAIKLFSVTLYVNYFKIFNNLGSRQPLGSSKNQFHLTFLTQVFHR